MLKSMLFAAFLMLGIANANAQNSTSNVIVTQVVESSSDDVWSLLRQMDDIDKYSSLIGTVKWTGAHGVGGQRVCHPPKGSEGGSYTERIVKFDDQNRTYDYAIIEGVPVKNMVNSFKVVDLGYNKCMIVWTCNYEQFIKNEQMTEEQFQGFLNMAANEMIANISKGAQG